MLSQLGFRLLSENTMTISDLGRKRFISSYRLQSIIKESQGRNSGRNLEAGTDIQAIEDSLPQSILPQHTAVKKMHHRFAHKPI